MSQNMVAASLSSNEKRVLNVIWRKGSIARQDIATHTGLTTASITRITKQLLDENLITSNIEKTGTRGNQRQPISINPDGALSIGVSFSHTFMDVGLIDLGGNLLNVIRLPLQDVTVDNLAKASKKGVASLLNSQSDLERKVLGIGFALPGDFASQSPYLQAHKYFPKLQDVDILSKLETYFDVPCYVENDCNASALGERVLGFGKEYLSFQSVFLGHGIGSGVIVDGELFRGVNGNAGAIGYMYPMDKARPSGQDLIETCQKAGFAIDDFCDYEAMLPLENNVLKSWFKRAGEQLCTGLSIAARLFDPEAIIIGGRVPPSYLQALVDNIDIDRFCSAGAPLKKPVIVASKLGPQAGVIGAAALPIYHTYLRSDFLETRDNYINGRR